ncbi:MAG TPA: 30S ribosomal protein S1 [Candidatus Kapabacteria bacterium]|nr:30S ribosomal protein S1 [Candidatus Kapabacteria bacterium]
MSEDILNQNEESTQLNPEINQIVNSIESPIIKEQSIPMKPLNELLNDGFDNLEMDDSQFQTLFEDSVSNIKEDQLIKGRIVDFTKDEIAVDIGFKSYGYIPRAELINPESYRVGDIVEVYVENLEDSTGKIVLSRRHADFMKIWQRITELYEKQETVSVKILRRIKGGMVVDLMGVEAFLPGSQIDIRPVRDFDSWVGQNIDIKVVKINQSNYNVVVSHKVLLEEEMSEQRAEIMSRLEKGLVLEGVVKAIADFGIFVDLGGVDGLVHITDLSWGRVTHPSEVVQLDQPVKVVVLDFDQDKKRISLGMKQLTPHPWDSIGDKYLPGTKVHGKVVSLTDYGAFIEIEHGIEGLIHISEMSWTQHIKHPSQVVSLGQEVDAIVLNIDTENKKLALGMKQLTPDPWADLVERYPIGSKHTGIVRNITNFGAFVELEPGVDGLVHISDLSWTKKIRHPGEFVKKGENLDVVVIGIDLEQRRISLGHKQVFENPWEKLEEIYKVGNETQGKISRIIEKGIIVELPDGVDGFVPVSQLSFAPVKNISEYFKIGDVLPLKVVEFDKDAKKIVLSAVEALRGKDQSIIDEYNSQHPVPNVEQYQTYEVKFESLREEIASMESETESYLRQEVNFYPSLEEAFEEIKEEKIEIKNTEPLRLADIQAKIHEVTPQKEEKNEQPVEQNENSNNAEVETKTDEKSQTDEIQIAEETKDSSSEEINPEEDTTEN